MLLKTENYVNVFKIHENNEELVCNMTAVWS